MTERQRIDEHENENELRGGQIHDLAAEVPTAPAISTPTSVEDQTRMPRDEQRADADNNSALMWIAGSILVTVFLLILLFAFNWMF